MDTQAFNVIKQDSSLVRRSLKSEIDELPESLLLSVFEFLTFEKQRRQLDVPNNDAQAPSKKKAAFERLQKYSGTIHFEKHWKEELYEALDEKYHYSY
jgi:hypothetical protein